MKKTIVVFGLILLMVMSFASAYMDATGDSFTFSQPPATLSRYQSDGTDHYILVARDDQPLGGNGIYRYTNLTGNYTNYTTIPVSLDIDYLAYDSNYNRLITAQETDQRLMVYATGSQLGNGSYFGSEGVYGIESSCGFATGGNIYDLHYNAGYIYAFSVSGGEKRLCILSSLPSVAVIAKHNITSGVASGIQWIDGSGLTTDRLNVLSGGYVYVYSINGNELTENSLTDTYFPSSTSGTRGTYINGSGAYLHDTTDTVYKHNYSGVPATTQFPYREIDGVYYSYTQCFQQINSGCLGDTSNYLCDGDALFTERDACHITYGYTYGIETACGGQTNIDYCVGGCTTHQAYDDNYGINYYYGKCEPVDCTNECSSVGWHCISGRSRRYCDSDYDSDLCLEYSSITACSDGQFCSDGYCYDYNFTRVNNELNIPQFELIYNMVEFIDNEEELSLLSGTKYSIDEFEPNTLNVRTTNTKHVQLFGHNPIGYNSSYLYTSIDCDYKERLIGRFEVVDGIINSSNNIAIGGDVDEVDRGVNDWWLEVSASPFADIINITYPITRSNSLIDFHLDFFDTDTESLLVFMHDENDNTILSFTINETNATSQELTFTQINSTGDEVQTIFIDGGTGTLERVLISIIVDHINEIWTLHVKSERTGETTEHFSVPLEFYPHGHESVSIDIELIDGDGFYLQDFSLTQIDTLPIFNERAPNDFNDVCTYGEGCYLARMFLNVEDTPVYHAYRNVTVCVDLANNLGQDNDLDEMSTTMKMLVALGIILFVFLFFGIIGYASNDMRVAMYGGGLVATGWLIVAGIIGWLPVWIIILMIVVGAGLVAKGISSAIGG